MKRWFGLPVAAIALTACVTINVYFPAAEAKEAAKEFVEKVIGDEAAQDDDAGGGDGGMAMLLRSIDMPRVDPLALVGIGTAHAQGYSGGDRRQGEDTGEFHRDGNSKSRAAH